MASTLTHHAVLNFWFKECTPQQWFKKDAVLDATIEARFGAAIEEGLAGSLDAWTESQAGCLALILILDQFTRNVYRGTPEAFSGDSRALAICTLCCERGYLEHPDHGWRHFMLVPMMHSEDIQVQEASLPLFQEHTDERVYSFATRHRDIIARFGRYPHRNIILGRASTDEELDFLQEPGSSF
jgi:uncharacterized protein (DUF924 family)